MGANRFEREIYDTLKGHEAVCVQTSPHEKWKFPDGRTFVLPATPSDSRYARNALADLKRILGLTAHETVIGERREKNRTSVSTQVDFEGEFKEDDDGINRTVIFDPPIHATTSLQSTFEALGFKKSTNEGGDRMQVIEIPVERVWKHPDLPPEI